MDSHYTAISSKFNSLFEPIHHANTPLIINKLQLKPDDLCLDIGAATGQQAHLVWKQVGLKNPITCVEPCKAFLEYANNLDGIVPVGQTAEQFCNHLAQHHVANQKPFNKVLLCGVAHHVDDICKVLTQIIDYLPKNGVCVILNHPSTGLSVPFTALHLQHWAEASDPMDKIIPYLKARDDVIKEVTTEEAPFRVSKSRWYYMIRNRFWSNFHRYTDEEIEESIKELDNERLKGVKDDEPFIVEDKWVAVKITKKELEREQSTL